MSDAVTVLRTIFPSPATFVYASGENPVFTGTQGTYVVQFARSDIAEGVQNILRKTFTEERLEQKHVIAGHLEEDCITFTPNTNTMRTKGMDLFLDLRENPEKKLAAIQSAGKEIAQELNKPKQRSVSR